MHRRVSVVSGPPPPHLRCPVRGVSRDGAEEGAGVPEVEGDGDDEVTDPARPGQRELGPESEVLKTERDAEQTY